MSAEEQNADAVELPQEDDAEVDTVPIDAPFTPEEKETFDKLRARLEDMKGDPIADDFLADDSVMWRFYSAHADGQCPGPEDKVEAALAGAEKQFRDSIAWRHEEGVDAMWERWRGAAAASSAGGAAGAGAREPAVQLGSYVFHGQGRIPDDARTRAGGPVVFERVGQVDAAGITADDEVAAAVREAYIMSLETAWRTNRACGGRARTTIVMDLDGLGWGIFNSLKLLRELAKIGPPNFPELTDRILVVRAPWLLKALFKVVGPLLPPRTRAKVRVSSSNWLAKLTATVRGGVAALPDFLGGEKGPAEHMVCPAMPVAEARKRVAEEQAAAAAAAAAAPAAAAATDGDGGAAVATAAPGAAGGNE